MFCTFLGCQYPINWIRGCETCWLWCFCTNYSNNQQKKIIYRNTILDGTRGKYHRSVLEHITAVYQTLVCSSEKEHWKQIAEDQWKWMWELNWLFWIDLEHCGLSSGYGTMYSCRWFLQHFGNHLQGTMTITWNTAINIFPWSLKIPYVLKNCMSKVWSAKVKHFHTFTFPNKQF